MTADADPDPTPLARLLALAFRELVDDLHRRLAEQGWHDVRPRYGYVLLAVRDDPRTVVELAGVLDVTKQAASKLVDEMEGAGYVRRRPHRDDARAKSVTLTPRGRRLLDAVEAIYGELEAGWADVVGAAAVEQVRSTLEQIVASGHEGRLPDVRPT